MTIEDTIAGWMLGVISGVGLLVILEYYSIVKREEEDMPRLKRLWLAFNIVLLVALYGDLVEEQMDDAIKTD